MAEYQVQPVRFGLGGLDLRRAPDLVAPENALRLTNVIRVTDGAWTARPGQTAYATATGTHHTIRRLEDPVGGTVTRIWGVGTTLARGASGALTTIDTGYSGNPLTTVLWHPPQSGESWIVVADSTRMSKVRASDGLRLPLGLPAPAAPTAAADALLTKSIEEFESGFIPQAGTGGLPVLSYPAGIVGQALQYVATPVGTSIYYNYAIQDYGGAQDLLHFAGPVEIEDDDYVHLWLLLNHATLSSGLPATNEILAINIYAIINFGFGTTFLPGTNDAQNTQYYKLTLTPSAIPALTGGAWVEFGAPASSGVVPLRKRDFTRYGSIGVGTNGWEAIAGVCVQVVIDGTTLGGALAFPVILFDNLFFEGGGSPDTGETDAVPYTYKVTNFDSRTGAEGNGSVASAEISPNRQTVTVDPVAYGDAAIRQRFYRKGGSANDDWHFVGVNTSDGGTLVDNISDTEAEVGEIVPTDHFEPVPTVDAAGVSVLDQPVPYIWGPVNGVVYAAGDKYRPGAVYRCKPGEIDHWGAADFSDVCGPSEKMIGGFVLGTQAYAWSTQKLYVLVSAVEGVDSTPSGCTRAPAGPWAFVLGAGLCFFCASDGIFMTNGGEEEDISSEWIRPLFRGETSNGYAPVDFTTTTALRMEVRQNELWWLYKGTDSIVHTLIYNLQDKLWRAYQFAKEPAVVYSETVPGTDQLLIGSTNVSYLHSGFSDGGTAISCNVRTGTLTQGQPRSDKLYGDLVMDLDRQGVNINVTPYMDHQGTVLPTEVLRTGSGRNLYRYNFDLPPYRSINAALDLAWASSTARPSLYTAYLSYLNTPESVQGRPTDLELAGNLSTKIVKGIVLEVDTLGIHKLINVEIDGVVLTTLNVVADGRRVLEFAFAPGEGHEIRLIPADHDVSWELYSYQWLFDLEPYTLVRWETQILNHGMPGWQIPTHAMVALKSSSAVTLTVTGYNEAGTALVKTYTIPSTFGAKTKVFVPFEATKGILYKYLLTSPTAFRLYREESWVMVQPWAGNRAEMVHIFGNDDLDPSRGMGVASFSAEKPGGQLE